ncbi:hypothetical protein Btru_068117 [Bulinus truncatus]|nr:hypothetical protein Btru_068117 [Bulinus truncatus]
MFTILSMLIPDPWNILHSKVGKHEEESYEEESRWAPIDSRSAHLLSLGPLEWACPSNKPLHGAPAAKWPLKFFQSDAVCTLALGLLKISDAGGYFLNGFTSKISDAMVLLAWFTLHPDAVCLRFTGKFLTLIWYFSSGLLKISTPYGTLAPGLPKISIAVWYFTSSLLKISDAVKESLQQWFSRRMWKEPSSGGSPEFIRKSHSSSGSPNKESLQWFSKRIERVTPAVVLKKIERVTSSGSQKATERVTPVFQTYRKSHSSRGSPTAERVTPAVVFKRIERVTSSSGSPNVKSHSSSGSPSNV